MNKEIHRKSIPTNPADKNSSRSRLGPKTVLSIAILLTLVIETVKSILVTSTFDSEANIKLLALFLAGSILALLLYFFFSICITRNSPKVLRAFKELLAVACFILFQYPLFDTYFKNQDGETNPLANLIGLNSLVAILLIAMFAADIFELSTYAKFLIIAFYFLVPCFKSLIESDEKTGQTYINILVPLLYLTIILILTHIYNAKKEQLLANKKSTKLSSIIEQMQDSVILYDRKGNIDLLNGFVKKFAEDKRLPPADVLLKIREVCIVNEKKLVPKTSKFQSLNESQENLTSQDESYIIEKADSFRQPVEDISPVLINLDEITSARPMIANNLENILKTLLFNVTSHEIVEPKVMKYRAKFEADKKKFQHLDIKVKINPKSSTPITIIIRDVTSQQILDEQSACEKTRQALASNLMTEINNVVASTKIILEDALLEMRVKNKLEDYKEILVNITQQMLSPIMASVGDISDFCTVKRTKLKYAYAPCDLKKVLDKILVLFNAQAKQQNNKILVEFKQDPQGSTVANTDQKRLIQLMVRLVSNAIKNTTNGTIKITINAYNGSFSVHIEDNGKGIKEADLEKITEDLKIYQANDLKLIHSKATKTQGLPIAQMLALGLGPKSIAGLTIKSQYGVGTTVWFIIENKQTLEDDGKSEIVSPHLIQKRGFSPMKPSRFKMTFDYDAQDASSIIDVNESVGINNIVNLNLEAQMSRKSGEFSPRRSADSSPKRSGSLISAVECSNTPLGKKSKFAEREEQVRIEMERIDEVKNSVAIEV